MKKKNERIIPLIFATDDNYFPFLTIALQSIVKNCDKSYKYKVYILQTKISESNKSILTKQESENLSIEYVDVTKQLDNVGTALHLRDYYTNTIYYRLFIPTLFPQYDKVLYLDCDIILKDDIAKLFNTNINDYLMGVIQEDVMNYYDVFGKYAEKALGVERTRYFNSGILLMNLKYCRKFRLENKFVSLLKQFRFIVAPDQDYLNVLCKDKVLYLDRGWNKSPLVQKDFNEESLKLIHYKMEMKPWHKDGVRYGEYFWNEAKNSDYYNMLLEMKNNYTQKDIENEKVTMSNLMEKAKQDSYNKDNYINTLKNKFVEQNNNIDFEKFINLFKLNIVFKNHDSDLQIILN